MIEGIAGLTPRERIRAIVAGSAGNLIEWFDFYVYAFTALYFAPEFFPDSDPLAQVMATSGIFAVGFLIRPVGGWYFGRYADRHGRQKSMVLSVVLMGIGSALIACVPTYAQVGAVAPALLLLGRMVQGFSTGGEYGAAATYLSEIAVAGRRGFYASFQYVTLIGGQLLATALVLLLQHVLSPDEMRSWGWRLAFAIGAVGAGLVLLLRRGMPETTTADQRSAAAGTIAALRQHIPAFLTVLGLTAGGSLFFYTFTTYMQKYLVLTTGLEKGAATLVMTAVLIPFMLMQPLFGLLSDRIGRRTNLLLFGALATIGTVPLLSALATASSGTVAFFLGTRRAGDQRAVHVDQRAVQSGAVPRPRPGARRRAGLWHRQCGVRRHGGKHRAGVQARRSRELVLLVRHRDLRGVAADRDPDARQPPRQRAGGCRRIGSLPPRQPLGGRHHEGPVCSLITTCSSVRRPGAPSFAPSPPITPTSSRSRAIRARR